jgi:hypothetical protein
MEINGWIYMWYHAEGIEPNWVPEEIEEIRSGMWQYKGRTEHFINAHIEVWFSYNVNSFFSLDYCWIEYVLNIGFIRTVRYGLYIACT